MPANAFITGFVAKIEPIGTSGKGTNITIGVPGGGRTKLDTGKTEWGNGYIRVVAWHENSNPGGSGRTLGDFLSYLNTGNEVTLVCRIFTEKTVEGKTYTNYEVLSGTKHFKDKKETTTSESKNPQADTDNFHVIVEENEEDEDPESIFA